MGAKPQMTAMFVDYAADILAATQGGLTASEIARAMRGYAIGAGVEIPHRTAPFETPNKRTALSENLHAFREEDQYRILVELCDHPSMLDRNRTGAQKLKLQLMSKYGHLASRSLGSEINQELIEQTQHWLAPFDEVLTLYNDALQKYQTGRLHRNSLDDLRLAFESLLRALLNNSKSLENQIPELGKFVKDHGGSPELANMFVKLVDYYAKYQNKYVKHDSAVIEEEVEFIFEITSSFMKHLIRIAGAV